MEEQFHFQHAKLIYFGLSYMWGGAKKHVYILVIITILYNANDNGSIIVMTFL